MSVAQLGQVQLIETARLKPYPANARRISQRAVEITAESIRAFGWQQPIVADPQLVLIAGHVRHAAAKLLGEQTCPVVVAEGLSPAAVRAYRLADNRTHDYTTWDYGVLAAELETVEDFAGVLDLADWQGLIAAQAAAAEDGAGFLGDQGRARDILTAQHSVTVTFATQAEADAAGLRIFETIPGVINVRYGRGSAGQDPAGGGDRGQARADPEANGQAPGAA